MFRAVPVRSAPAARRRAALALCATGALLTSPPTAQAQATVKADGHWRAALGLGASASSGNSSATNLSFTGEGVRATDSMKTTLFGSAQYTRTDGTTTAERARLGGRHDHDLTPAWFAFGNAELERNVFANLTLRSLVGAGVGYHLIRTDETQFDLFGGLTYTYEKYESPMQIDDEDRLQYGYPSVMLAEESNHKLTRTTTLKQRLAVLPSVRNRGEYRLTLDSGLAVAMSETLSLTLGLTASHNSEPGPGRKTTDTLLTSGISVKFE